MTLLIRKLTSCYGSSFLTKDTLTRFSKLNLPLQKNARCIVSKSSAVFALQRYEQPSVNLFQRRYASTDVDKGSLVYQGGQSRLFKGLKRFSLTTSAIGACAQPYLLYQCADMSLLLAVPLFSLISLFVVGNPLLIHWIAKKYILSLYYNVDTKVFTAKILSFFAFEQTLTFTAADVEVPDIPSPFTMFKVKGRPLFADEADFTSIEVYKHMMGFDKPLDLKLGSQQQKNK